MKVYVYFTADCVVGVYATRELAETKGLAESIDFFGVEGHVVEEDLVTE